MNVALLSSVALSFPSSEAGAEVALELISRFWRPLPAAMIATIPSLKLPTTTGFLPGTNPVLDCSQELLVTPCEYALLVNEFSVQAFGYPSQQHQQRQTWLCSFCVSSTAMSVFPLKLAMTRLCRCFDVSRKQIAEIGPRILLRWLRIFSSRSARVFSDIIEGSNK